jgi:VTC domain
VIGVEPPLFADLAPISLDDLNGRAALLTRTDRKYVIDVDQLARVIKVLADSLRVLTVEQRVVFGYESEYLDTADWQSFLSAARRRPNRFKVRERTYTDDGTTWLEVKTRNRAGQTVKHRQPRPQPQTSWNADERAFVAGLVGYSVTDGLAPCLITRYQRSTLLLGNSRVTVDHHVTMAAPDGPSVGLGDAVVIETKSDGSTSPFDRCLWALGARPVPISKYGVGVAALNPHLPRNRWHRTISRYVPRT